MKGFKTETATVAVKILDYRKPAPEWGLIRRKQQGEQAQTEEKGTSGLEKQRWAVTDWRWEMKRTN